MPRLVHLAGWLVVLAVAPVAVIRLGGWEPVGVVQLIGFTPVLLLPAYVVAGLGVGMRRWALAAAGGLLVVCHLGFQLPEMVGGRPGVPADAPRLRVVSANLHFRNGRIDDSAAELRRLDADVLVLQELTPSHVDGLRRAGAFDGLPYSIVDAREDTQGSGLWSRYPLQDEDVWLLPEARALRATVMVEGSGPVRLWGVHTTGPSSRARTWLWREQLRLLAAAVESEDRPLVVAGDLNATRDHRSFRRLLDQGLEDAVRGWAPTWPRDGRLPLPLLRLDHVLVGDDMAVVSARVGKGVGSDHRPVIADLAVLVTER